MPLSIKKIPLGYSRYEIKCPYTMNPTRIVIHNTANDAPAENEIRFMQSNSAYTSFHYAVDDREAVQGIELWRNAWHAGDGANGKGNREGIAIEICYSKSGGTRFSKAEENAAELTAKLLIDFGWDVSRVTKHADYAQKYCPHRTLELGWQRFLEMVEAKRLELLGIKVTKTAERMTLNGYTIERAEDFCVKYWDKSKKKCAEESYINGGFFGCFSENGIDFTLPVGNIVCDIVPADLPLSSVKYLNPYVDGRKLRYGTFQNQYPEFHGKSVTTLVLPRNGKPYVDEMKTPPADARYAISGIPVVRDGVDVSFSSFVKPQGWDDSPFRAAQRNLIGLKGSTLYIISGSSKTDNFVARSEVYEKLLPFGFEQIIALDGGGSYYHRYKGKSDIAWTDREVNNLIIY